MGRQFTGAGRKWRGNAPPREIARERSEKKEHDSAAFIKLNVSFPDKAFPERPLLSGRLPFYFFLAET